jgi:hypothetical protein
MSSNYPSATLGEKERKMTEQSSGGIRDMQDRWSWLRELSHRLGHLRDETPSDAIEERDVLEAAREIVQRRILEVNRQIGVMVEAARERRT